MTRRAGGAAKSTATGATREGRESKPHDRAGAEGPANSTVNAPPQSPPRVRAAGGTRPSAPAPAPAPTPTDQYRWAPRTPPAGPTRVVRTAPAVARRPTEP